MPSLRLHLSVARGIQPVHFQREPIRRVVVVVRRVVILRRDAPIFRLTRVLFYSRRRFLDATLLCKRHDILQPGFIHLRFFLLAEIHLP